MHASLTHLSDHPPAFNGMDNGSLELRGVRLPRFHLCSRFARVDAKGRYVKVPDAHPKVAYLTMMQVRRRAGRQAGGQAGRQARVIPRRLCIHPSLPRLVQAHIHTYICPLLSKHTGARPHRRGGLSGPLQGRHHRLPLLGRPPAGVRRDRRVFSQTNKGVFSFGPRQARACF